MLLFTVYNVHAVTFTYQLNRSTRLNKMKHAIRLLVTGIF